MSKVERVHKNLMPYMYVRHEAVKKAGGRTYRIFSYGAYNAMGLIGPEENGIAIGCDTTRQLVLDKHAALSYGWYDGFENTTADAKLGAEVARLAKLPAAQFLAFIRAHPRWRGHSA